MHSYGGDKPKQLGRGPRFITCYICGKQFGKSSLPIHEKACIKKFKAVEAQKPKRERRPLPKKMAALKQGADMTIDEYNALAAQNYNDNMIKCQYCERTFREEAFRHHQNACGPGKSGSKKLGVNANTNGLGLGLAARSQQRGRNTFDNAQEYEQGANSARVECPHCFRKFATQSADRHIQVCAKVKHKPTRAPVSDSAYTDELGVRQNGRGHLAGNTSPKSAALATRTATTFPTASTSATTQRSTAKAVLNGVAATNTSPRRQTSKDDALSKQMGMPVSKDSSSFKMLNMAIDNLMEMGATSQQVKQAVSAQLKRWE